MYLNYLVDVPEVKGKITFRNKGNARYVYYEYDRIYDPDKKYTTVKRVTIGKVSADDELKMRPNENFKKYFPRSRNTGRTIRYWKKQLLEGRCIYGHQQDSKRYGIRQETGRNAGS